jgi:UMF1 family MFS transporter
MASRLAPSRDETSWILYDVANSAFVLVMVTAILPIYFKEVVSAGVPGAVATSNWAFGNSIASLLLAVLAPILGTLADYRGRKKPFFLFFLCTGLLFTLALVIPAPGQWRLCLAFYILARVGWAGANLFYDAFLVDVTTRERMDRISARGYGLGYIGSVIPFTVIIALIMAAGIKDGLPPDMTRLGFIIVAGWWLLFSIPAARRLRQKHYIEPSPRPLADSFRRLAETFANIRGHRQVFIFLAAYFFYIDGVGTIISMATAYGHDLGFGAGLLIAVILFIQIVAFPFTLLYGRLAERYGTRSMIMAGILVYILVTLMSFSLPFIGSYSIRHALFWVIALLVASSMGGVQALSRSYFGRLIPPEKSAEFFGFYNVCGKFAAIAGPLLLGVVSRLTGDTRWGVLAIVFLFAIGAWLLTLVEPRPDRVSR